MFSGLYNVSARIPDPAFVDWFLGSISEHSIERYSKSEEIFIISDTNIILSNGKNLYDKNCVICHGGPGVQRSDIGKGLNPVPPDLDKSSDLDLKEIFWIINNGIKMTGMPSFGPTTRDTTVWAGAYYVKNMMLNNKKNGPENSK